MFDTVSYIMGQKAGGGSGGGSGGGVFRVQITSSYNEEKGVIEFTSDKSFSEIVAANNEGLLPIATIIDYEMDNEILYMTIIDNSHVNFETIPRIHSSRISSVEAGIYSTNEAYIGEKSYEPG